MFGWDAPEQAAAVIFDLSVWRDYWLMPCS
jgi:hypothetical protein